MIKTLSPYSTTVRTAEIMSRYRPIAPKPELPSNCITDGSAMSPKIRQSPYLRNLWPQLQARPTRTRKRGRGALSVSPLSLKRQRVLGVSPPCPLTTSPAKKLSLQGFGHQGLPIPNLTVVNNGDGLENHVTSSAALVTLPLLPCTQFPETKREMRARDIDLNTVAEVPEEKDLLVQLQGPAAVISPQPIRPVGSSITVGCISTEEPRYSQKVEPIPRKSEEVEEDVDIDTLPAVITDSKNRVRMVNSAYKEMVGQPVCSWLEMMTGEGKLDRSASTRISGDVVLHLSEAKVPLWSNGFSCWVRIEWGNDGKKSSVTALCDTIRIACKSKDYLLIWRFHVNSKEVP